MKNTFIYIVILSVIYGNTEKYNLTSEFIEGEISSYHVDYVMSMPIIGLGDWMQGQTFSITTEYMGLVDDLHCLKMEITDMVATNKLRDKVKIDHKTN